MFVKDKKISVENKIYEYNDGELCRQKGSFIFYIIEINPFL